MKMSDLFRMSDNQLTLTAETERNRKLRFKIGLVLIVVSYIFWGAMFAFGALAIHNTDLPLWYVASAAFVLSWIVFAAGLWLAGIEASRMVRRRFLHFFGQKKVSSPTASPTVPSHSEALKNR